MDNAFGEEGAMALASMWHSAGVRQLIQAVVPDFPTDDSLRLFVDPREADLEVITSIGHSKLRDFHPGRRTLAGEQSGAGEQRHELGLV